MSATPTKVEYVGLRVYRQDDGTYQAHCQVKWRAPAAGEPAPEDTIVRSEKRYSVGDVLAEILEKSKCLG